jgi:Fe2+ transport system protein FeoA
MEVPLTELKTHQKATVVKIQGAPGVLERLNAMGIHPGSVVAKQSGQPMGGPVVVKVGRGHWALGHGLAKKILVEASE